MIGKNVCIRIWEQPANSLLKYGWEKGVFKNMRITW